MEKGEEGATTCEQELGKWVAGKVKGDAHAMDVKVGDQKSEGSGGG